MYGYENVILLLVFSYCVDYLAVGLSTRFHLQGVQFRDLQIDKFARYGTGPVPVPFRYRYYFGTGTGTISLLLLIEAFYVKTNSFFSYENVVIWYRSRFRLWYISGTGTVPVPQLQFPGVHTLIFSG